MSFYSGTAGNDDIGNVWDFAWTSLYMNDGNDWVATPITNTDYFISGGNGNDVIWSNGDDDVIHGGNGNDELHAGKGDDVLRGGAGSDRLDGGGGYDTFAFVMGDSQAHVGQADTITDWDVAHDWIDMTIRGRDAGYSETSTNATNIEDARYQVEHTAGLRDGDYAFLYNRHTDTGYLLADLNGNYTFETGVILRGAGAASDLNWSDIV